MSVEIKLKTKKVRNIEDNNKSEICELNEINDKQCITDNKEQLKSERDNRLELLKNPNENNFLYPILDDPNFNIKIAQKKEFSDTKYDGTIYDVEEYAKILKTAEYELLPQQAFVRNFMSFQTPYNSLLLFHGLGSGKTCSAIGVCEEMRDYLKQMGINKRIIIVASPNVQDNFKLQLFDERKLKEVDGFWTVKGCLGNKLLKEINPTQMKGLKKEKVIQLVKNLINSSYSFQGYLQFSNEIIRKSGKPGDSVETRLRNLEFEYSDRLIVIDEVHNIRISDDNENKAVAENLTKLVSYVSNIRLLLLSATPMFNSYKEIVWLLNLMNKNDRRGIISVSDIFDKNGDWKKDKEGKTIGDEILTEKATGYISYVRGENPYTFPFRVYPDRFAADHTFKSLEGYPKYQINGTTVPDDTKIQKLCLFLTNIGSYQHMGYSYIIDRLRTRGEGVKITRKGNTRKVAAFSALRSFGYTDLQLPIEALNIIYPHQDLEDLFKKIPTFEYVKEKEKTRDDIAPNVGKRMVAEYDEIMLNNVQGIKKTVNSELESESAITEGVEANEELFDKVVEPNKAQIKSVKKPLNKQKTNSIYDIIDEDTVVDDNEPKTKPSVKQVTSSSGSFKGSLVPFKGPLVPKKKQNETNGLHNIEGETQSIEPSEKAVFKTSDNKKGGEPSSKSSSSSTSEVLFFDPKDLTGSQGLKRIMDYKDTKTPSEKGQFEYKKGVKHVFNNDEIAKYSSKIKNICDSIYNKETNKVSEGIILIYSAYIDAGIIPIALALEEMGFTRYGEKVKPLFKTPPVPVVDIRTMKPPTSKKDFKPARYIMITGDPRISPNNDADVKAITNSNNIFKEDNEGNITDVSGEIIKVVLISQAGSEGLDFKAIRQVHILEPWYNVNRIEQIIGRGVRNFSHTDLPFSKRNVQIFLYGTLLENKEEEAADLYVYRISELKAIKIGKVTRLLKQTAVDCIINHEQTEFTSEKFTSEKLKTIEKNRNITQILSDHQKLEHFKIGDIDNSVACDFMKCKFECLPDIDIIKTELNTNTYNETFMLINSDKIIQKIKMLMKMRFFYKKKELFHLINTPKKYPDSQIYSALTQIITDNTEYISDKYDRTGYLINIGNYYLFQPSELNYKNISVYERSVPINYKHNMVKFQIKTNVAKPVIDKRNIILDKDKESEIVAKMHMSGKKVFETMFENYALTLKTTKVERGNKDWYELCGVTIRKMASEEEIVPGDTYQERMETLKNYLIEHIVDSLMMNDKIDLLNYIYSQPELDSKLTEKDMLYFFEKMRIYLTSKLITSKGITGIILFNGPSRKENINIYVLNKETNEWKPAEPEDKNDLEPGIISKYHLKEKMNKYVGFIGFETDLKYMVYKVKDTENKRSTGYRCDQSGKDKIMSLLNDIELEDKYISKVTKEGVHELCVKQEFTLRSLEQQEREKPKNKQITYFLDTETAIMNEFEKKDKKIKR